MKLITRNGTIWAIWLATVLLTGLILAWVSQRAMQSERDEARLTVRFENERLALWRMESRLLPMLSRESAWNSSSGVLGPETVKSGGLLGPMHASGFRWQDEQEFVSCRFHVDQFGRVFHPSATAWFSADLVQGLTSAQRDFSGRVAAASVAVLGELNRTPHVEDAIDLPSVSPPNAPFGQSLANAPAFENVDQQVAGAQLVQMSRNTQEYNRRSQTANTIGNGQSMNSFSNPSVSLPIAEEALISFWVEDKLLLARPVDNFIGARGVHGCVLNWDDIQRTLCDEVHDLLPNAKLVPLANDDAVQNLSLASIPARLDPGEVPEVALRFWSSMRVSLLVAWLGFAICAMAVGALLLGLTRLSQRRADFVSAVSHELRTPLTTFQIYTDLLADSESLTEEKRGRYLTTLKREATRLTGLVDNVLGFSRLESSSASTQVEQIDWQSFRESIVGSLSDRAMQSEMRIEFADDGVATVLANRSGLERILVNLIDNACKYAASSQPPVIRVEARIAESKFEIRVRDNGPGLSPSARARLFKPFSKSATEAARTAHGVGLGLSLCRGLARSMRGDLLLEKSDEGGCVFLLQLRLAHS